MDEDNKKSDIGAEIEKVFQAGDRKTDPVAHKSAEKFRARIKRTNAPLAAVLQFLADDALVSAFIEETRRNLVKIEADPHAAPNPPHPIDKDLAQAILTGQAEMRAEIAEMRAVTMDLKAATDKTIAATAEIKTASEIMHTDVRKAVRALTLGAAFRTAIFLTPFSLVSSVVGNEATPAVDHILSRVFGWKAAPTVPSAPPSPPTVNLDNRQYWIVLAPPEFDRPFVIPPEASPHRRPRRLVTTHPKVRSHTKAPR